MLNIYNTDVFTAHSYLTYLAGYYIADYDI